MNKIQLQENWDWALFYYLGTIVLNMSEDEFWKCTPRKLFTLLKIHDEVKGTAEEEKDKISDQAQAVQQFMKW